MPHKEQSPHRKWILVPESAIIIGRPQNITRKRKRRRAPVFVALHIPPYRESSLPEILTRSGPLHALHPEDGARIKPGFIYVAPPDHHLLIESDRIVVTKGPKENRFRPSIDTLFGAAAYNYGPRTIGVILSGALDDGTAGLWSVKRCD
jgi:two-component system chemotaxis response regulator CheB